MGGQKQITENILSMPCSSLSSNYPQHLPQTGGQEIAEQAVLWVMAGDSGRGFGLDTGYDCLDPQRPILLCVKKRKR